MVTEKVSRILQEIKKDKALETYFFQKLGSTDKPFRWLEILKERGFLDPQNNPVPQRVDDKKESYVIPHWNVLGYFENLSKHIKIEPNKRIIENFVEIIDSIINYRDVEGNRIENYRTDWAIVKALFNLPIEYITVNHIKFLKTALQTSATLISGEIIKTVLPHLIRNNSKTLMIEFLKICLDHRKEITPYFSRYVSILGDYWFNELLKKFKTDIYEVCGLEAAKIGISKIESIINENRSEYSIGYIVTIEDSQHNLEDTYKVQSVFFVRDILIYAGPERIKSMVKNLLQKDHSIFKRLALYVISYYYDELNEIFWKTEENPLEEIEIKHELFDLFKNNCEKFTDEQLERILFWIETKKYVPPEQISEKPEEIEKFLAYRKKEWLLSLLGSNYKKIQETYREYDQKNPTKIEHPGFLIWFSGVFVGPEPKPIERELVNRPNQEIVEYLNSQGNPESFRITVKRNPKKFSKDMKPFLNLSREMQHALLSGLYDAWRSNDDFSWDELLSFILMIVEDEVFWKQEHEGSNLKDWIVRKAAELVEIGTKDDVHSFDERLLPLAEKILLILAEKDKSELFTTTDLVNSVLNSPKGAIFSAMIYYSLRSVRIKKNGKWNEKIKRYFEKSINKGTLQIELFVTLGLYLIAIYYHLEQDWVKENINKILPKDHEENWKAALNGYLFASSRVYKEIYELLKTNNHYHKALDTTFEEEFITRRLVEHITVGYLNSFEILEDKKSLIYHVIMRNDPKQLSYLVNFFRRASIRDSLTEELKGRIAPLWEKLVQVLEQAENDLKIQEVLVSLSNWITLVDELDQKKVDLLKASIRYMKADYRLAFFIENLLKHVDKTPDEVGEFVLEMLNTGLFVTIKEKNLQHLVRRLYEQERKDIADKICYLYARKGIFFLKEVYDEYNP